MSVGTFVHGCRYLKVDACLRIQTEGCTRTSLGCYRCNDRCCRGRRRSVFFLCAKEDAGVSVSGRDRIGCCGACSGDPRFDGSHVGPMMCKNECVRSH